MGGLSREEQAASADTPIPPAPRTRALSNTPCYCLRGCTSTHAHPKEGFLPQAPEQNAETTVQAGTPELWLTAVPRKANSAATQSRAVLTQQHKHQRIQRYPTLLFAQPIGANFHVKTCSIIRTDSQEFSLQAAQAVRLQTRHIRCSIIRAMKRPQFLSGKFDLRSLSFQTAAEIAMGAVLTAMLIRWLAF